METLPPELILLVMNQLSGSDGLQWRSTCRRYRDILSEMQPTRKEVFVDQWIHPMRHSFMVAMKDTLFCKMATLRLHLWRVDEHMMELLHMIPMHHLQLHQWFPEMTPFLPRLEILDLTMITLQPEMAKAMAHVPHIRLHHCALVSMEQWQCSMLHVSGCSGPPNLALPQHLQLLSWSDTPIRTRLCAQELLLGSHSDGSFEDMMDVTEFLRLRLTYLDVFAATPILQCRRALFQHVNGPCPRFARIEELEISSVTFLTTFTYMPTLRSLTFSQCIWLNATTVPIFHSLGTYFPNLERLSMNSFQYLSFCQDMPKLYYLHLDIPESHPKFPVLLQDLPTVEELVHTFKTLKVDSATMPKLRVVRYDPPRKDMEDLE